MKQALKLGLLAVVASLASGCVSFPIEDYNLARAAMDAAREKDAARFAPGWWYKAEEAYKQAVRLYRERSFGPARDYFIQARFLAEKAENTARLEQFKTGEGLPQ